MADKKNTFGLGPLDSVLAEYQAGLGQPLQSQGRGIDATQDSPSGELPEMPRIDQRQPSTYKPAGGKGLLPPPDYVPVFEAAAIKYNVPVNVLMALAQQESSYNPGARGEPTKWGQAGGLMQYLPSTAKMMGINPFDPNQSIDAAAKQIRQRLDKGYSMEDAVKEHFAGPDRKLWGPKTQEYGISVLDKARRIGAQLYPDPLAESKTDGPMSVMADGPMSVPAGTPISHIPRPSQPVSSEQPAQEPDPWDAEFARQAKPATVGDNFADAGRSLKIGINSAALNFRELASKILPKDVIDAIDSVDTLFQGQPSDQLLKADTKAMVKAMTPQMRVAMKKKWWDSDKSQFGSAWTDWRAYSSGILQSAPEMVVTMAPSMLIARGVYTARVASGVAKEIAAKSAARAAMLTGAVSEGAMGGASSSREVRDAIMDLKPEVLETSDAYKAMIAQGMTPDKARAVLAEDAASRAFVTAGVATGIFGGMGDRAIAKIVGEKLSGNVLQRLAKGAAKGAVGEGLFEELPQSALQQVAQNEAMRRANQNQELTHDVLNQALGGMTIGALQGGVMGGGAGALAGPDEATQSRTPDGAGQDGATRRSSEADVSMAVPKRAGQAPDIGIKPGENAVWRNADHDQPVTFHGIEGTGSDGRVYARVELNGQQSFVPADELFPASKPKAEAETAARGAPVTETTSPDGTPRYEMSHEEAPSGPLSRAVQTGEQAAFEQSQVVPEGMPPIGTPVLVAPEGIEPIQATIEGYIGSDVMVRDAAGNSLQIPANDPALQLAPAENFTVTEDGEVIPQEAQDAVAGNRNDGLAGAEVDGEQRPGEQGTGEGDAQVSAQTEQAPAAAAEEGGRHDDAGASAAADTQPALKTDYSQMSLEQLVERRKYLSDQAVNNRGWDKRLTAEKRKVETAIRKIDPQALEQFKTPSERKAPQAEPVQTEAAQPEQTPQAEQPSLVPQETDVTTGQGKPLVAFETLDGERVLVRRDQFDEGLEKLAAFHEHGGRRIGTMQNVKRSELRTISAGAENAPNQPETRADTSSDGGVAQPPNQADQAAIPAEPVTEPVAQEAPTVDEPPQETPSEPAAKPKTASKADLEHLFGVDKKREAALERIAKGRAWFGDKAKANAFITKNGLKDTHEAVQTGAKRWEPQPKAESQPVEAAQEQASASVPSIYTGKPDPKNSAPMPTLGGYSVGETVDVPTRTTPRSTIETLFVRQVAGDPIEMARLRRPDGGAIDVAVNELSKVEAAQDQATPDTSAQTGEETAQTVAEESQPARNLAAELAGLSNRELSALIDDVANESPEVVDTAKPISKRKRRTSPKGGRVAKPREQVSVVESTDTNNIGEIDRTAGEIAKSLGYNVSNAGMEAIKGLTTLFGGSGKLSSGLTFDEETYAQAKPHFQAMLADAQAAGKDLRDFIRLVLNSFGTGVKPYIIRFANDLRDAEDTQNAGSTVRGDSSSPLEAVEADRVQGVEEGGDAEPASAGSEQGSGEAGSATDGVGLPEARSGGSGTSRADTAASGARRRVRKSKQQKAADAVLEGAQDAPSLFDTDADADIREAAEVAPANIPASDFVIDDSLELGKGSESVKYADNLAAIRTLKQIEAEGRRATPQEQRILARYVGWGGLKNAFRVAGAKEGEGVAKGWEKRVAELEELLTPEELKAARNSTTAAHYTSQAVVQAMWRAAERLGFAGGAVLEPSVGTGNFLGLMPQHMRGKSNVFAVEYDSLTARIAQQLYPNAEILHSGFQNVPIPRNQFALAIGNPPFGRESLTFRSNPSVNGKSIHNQFFLASMDALAEDGVLAMVVSHNLMDALDASNRLAMAERAHFLGAIRLPDTAFQENARTEVVTDILFFRKRPKHEAELAAQAVMERRGMKVKPVEDGDRALFDSIRSNIDEWVDSATIPDPAGSGENINVNGYFTRRPNMVVGKIDASGKMNARADLNVRLEDPAQFEPMLNAAIDRLPKAAPNTDVAESSLRHFKLMATAMRLAVNRAEPGSIQRDADGNLKMVVDIDAEEFGKSILQEITLTADTPFNPEYTLTLDGKWQRTVDKLGEDGKPLKVVNAQGKATNRNQKEVITYEKLADIPQADRWGQDRIDLVTDLLPVRNLFKRQITLESQNAPEQMLEGNRKRLNEAYDSFVAKHGTMHSPKVSRIALMMPDGALAMATEEPGENGKGKKAAIMSRRVVEPPKVVERVKDVNDAIALSLSESGTIDLDRIASLLGTDQAGAERALSEGENPRAFYDPELERWEPADLYLSGLVRRKLNAAKAAGLEANVKALESVIPEDWDASQIVPNIGSAWIPPSVYGDFIKHLGYSSARVSYSPVTNAFSVSYDGQPSAQWATTSGALPPGEIASRLLNSQPMKVVRTDSEGKTYVDQEATAESQQKANEIFNEFLDWAYQDDARRNELVRIFNEKYNTRLVRQRDGSHLKLPGKSPFIKMRRHQLNAIWRGITDRAVLYDHVVGAGKTFVAIARAMERRRMGLSRKPMVVVPNHLVEQWAKDAKLLYPGANVLAAGKADFERKNRRRLFARIASGDYDMVIIGHSSFGFIDLDQATEERYLNEELAAAHAAVKEAQEEAESEGKSGWRKPFGVKEAERLVKKLEDRLARLRDTKRDRLLTFEEMGIDDLTVDEAHEFKNLAYSSRLTGVSGMGNKTGSQKAMDLHLKVRSLNERPGTSVSFLTGTPISNSVAEMYLVLRNLVPDEMREMGIDNFDAWRSMYVSYASAYEPTEAGGVKEVTRLGREWMNMKSLMDLYYSVADAVTIEDIKTAFAEDNPGKKFPVPDVASARKGDGDREMVAVKPTPEQRAILAEIVSGFEALDGIKDPKERNAQRLRLMDRARKVSLDPRAVDPSIEVKSQGGKISAVVNNVARIYKKWDADKGTQIIFLDRSVPKAKGDEKIVQEYDALRKRLQDAINAGDEREEQAAVDALEKYDPNEMESLRAAVNGGWNAYDEIKRQLVEQGIPADEIRFVQEANTDKQKADLFNLVKKGDVRVLIGSTPRMGAGTNVQDRLVALHHVDVTWKPSDIEQREGRIVRQGNLLLEKYGDDFQVDVIAYATEMTVDAKMWALNATKLKAINGIRKYDGSFQMEFEDEESASMAEMAALATGNPLMVERVTLNGEIQKLEMQERSYKRRINSFRDKLAQNRRLVDQAPGRVKDLNAFADEVEQKAKEVDARSKARSITVQGKTYRTEQEAYDAAQEAITQIRGGDEKARFSIEVGGEKVTSQEQINRALQTAFGDEGFEAEIGGQVYNNLSDAARAIVEATNSKSGSREFTIDGITLNGIPVEVDVSMSRFGANERDMTFSAVNSAGRQMAGYFNMLGKEAPSFAKVRAGLGKLMEQLHAGNFRAQARQIERNAKQAQSEIPGLETEVAKPWPQAEDLKAKRDRLKEVIAELSSTSDAARLATDAAPEEAASDDGPRYSIAVDGGRLSASSRGTAELRGQSPLEIRSTAAQRDMDKAALRNAVFNPLLASRDTVLANPDVGAITINRKGLTKSRANASDRAKLLTMPRLSEIVRDGAYLGSRPADGKGDGIAGYHYVARRVTVDGVPLTALVTLEEKADGRIDYYNHTVTADVDGATPAQTGPVDGELAAYRRPAFSAEPTADRSTAGNARHAEIRRALNNGILGGVFERLMGDGRITLHPTEESLPGSVRVKGAAIQGYTDGAGRIHLVAENLTPQTAMAVLLHEAFHGGGEPLVGNARWQNMSRQLRRYYEAAQRRKAEGRTQPGDFWDEALRRVENAGAAVNPARAAEEFGAYAIENYELAPPGIKKWVDTVLGIIKDWIARRFGVQVGAITPAQLRAFAVAALRNMDATQPATTDAVGGMALGDGALSVDDRYFVNEVLAELAQHDDFFQVPISHRASLEGVFSEAVPHMRYAGVEPILESDRAEKFGAERMHTVMTAQGQEVRIYEDNDRVWMDISRVDEGGSGSAAYAAVGNYAYNTNREFIGDPAGLSDIALRRRTDAMLSSALKFGTTRHLRPHPRQISGDASLGVPPLRWQDGDDAANIRALIDVSLESLAANVPEFKRARYDFASKTFVSSSGKPISDGLLRTWAGHRRVRASGAGSSSLKRAMLLQSLVRAESGERPGLLEQVFRQSAQMVAPGASLNRISYSVADQGQGGVTESRVKEWINGKLTDLKPAMLAAIPLNYFTDLARPNMVAVKDYLDGKRAMDAYRGRKHAEADQIAQKWLKFRAMDRKAARQLAALMHDSTRLQIDPSESNADPDLSRRYKALPEAGKQLYKEVRDTYLAQSRELDEILIENVRQSMDLVRRQAERRYEQRLQEIRDEGLKGEERAKAEADAEKVYKTATTTAAWSAKARITKLRQVFEANRLQGPYFPLARFGQYFVTVRDVDGSVISFSRRESAADMKRLERQMAQAYPTARIETGVLSNKAEVHGAMDPRFVAEVEEILSGAQVSDDIKDQVWQRYLESMPDMSTRKRFIHRKGTEGFEQDALRSFSSHMFHAAHQMARLKYGQQMGELVNQAEDQARVADDPIRGMQLANELRRRHDWVMNPTGGKFAQVMTSAAFVWHLGLTPAAALVNLSQTVLLGVPVIGARFGLGKTQASLLRAFKDYGAGRGSVQNAKLTADEKRAMEAFYESGLIDRTQAHDLAGVGETGIEYSAMRQRVMGVISFLFHQTERLNREVTALAAYRLARDAGQDFEQALDSAHELTWKTHFDYSNSNRPRLMQNDVAKVALVFRNYQINMLYRLFRDIHQSFKGETPQARKEARIQLVGIMGMMALNAGLKGTPFFAIAMILMGLAFDDDDDKFTFEERLRGDIIDTLGPELGGILWNGIPGHYLGIDLTARIGMPDLWFRSPNRELQGKDEYQYWLSQVLGAGVGIFESLYNGVDIAMDGNVVRGVETAAPKAIKDLIKGWRYATEGATTLKGEQYVGPDDLSAWNIISQAIGFTPAVLVETYERNNALKNAETRIIEQRRKLLNEFALARKLDDEEAKAESMARIKKFNKANPEVRIDGRTLVQSLRARKNTSRRTEDGIVLDKRLDRTLRREMPEYIYRDE